MNDLDEELRAAVAESETADPVDVGVVKAAYSNQALDTSGNRTRNLGLLAALLVTCGSILALVLGSTSSAVYALGVDKFLAKKEQYSQRNVRVQGYLTKGSLMKRAAPCEYRFKIYDVCAVDQPQREELSVHYPRCIVPDSFQDRPEANVEVTAEGRMSADGRYLEATHIMAKCPSRYEPEGKQPPPAHCDEN